MNNRCYLACYVCGKPIGNEPYLMRGNVDENGLGAVEACHQDENCSMGLLAEPELEGSLVDPNVPLHDVPE